MSLPLGQQPSVRSFARDYVFGLQQETNVFAKLKLLDSTINKTGQYCPYDFEGEHSRIELKSRTNALNKFPTTLMPFKKSAHIITNKKLYFAFNFTDGLYYIEYTPETFDNIEVLPFCRHKRSDYDDKEQLYYHIPVNRLTKLE